MSSLSVKTEIMWDRVWKETRRNAKGWPWRLNSMEGNPYRHSKLPHKLGLPSVGLDCTTPNSNQSCRELRSPFRFQSFRFEISWAHRKIRRSCTSGSEAKLCQLLFKLHRCSVARTEPQVLSFLKQLEGVPSHPHLLSFETSDIKPENVQGVSNARRQG
jgi:hypothetical protein